jgi:apolipoprotein N-acyltransferase
MYDEAKDFLDGLGKEARAHHSDLLIGVLYEDAATGRYYNSMVSVGSARAFYHKRHLVPFTEYLPLKGLLGGIVDFMQVPMSDFSAGPAVQPPLAVAGQQAGISICYEDAFGEEVIRELPRATLLVNVSNDAWFGHSIAPQQHLEIARMRAVETGRPLLRATNTGVTAIVDAKGRLQKTAPQFEVAALTGEVQPMQGATPYVRVGNDLVVVLMAGMLMIPWLLLRRRAMDRNSKP